MWGLLIAHHLDQSFYDRPIRNTELQLGPIYYSFLEAHNWVAPFTSHSKLHEFGAEKSIS
jgi:hypothetical protein